MNEAQVSRTLQKLVGAQLVHEEPDGQFAFRHALTRDAVYGSLLLRERRSFHRLIAETIEREAQQQGQAVLEARLSDLAYHYYEAGAWDKAEEYSRRAGEKAQAFYAPREAVEHWSHAIKAAQHLPAAPLTTLFRSRGQAYETMGDFEAARADYERARQEAIKTHDERAEWQSLIDLGFLWASKDYTRTGDYFKQALARARTLGDARLLGHSLNRYGNWLANIQQTEEAQREHKEALKLFESLNDQAGIAETVDLLGMANTIGGNMLQAKDWYDKAISLFKELDLPRGLASSLTTQAASPAYTASAAAPALSVPEALARAEQALAVAREIGQRSAEAYALWVLASLLGVGGQYGRALETGRASLQVAEEIDHRQWITAAHVVLGAIYLDLFALDEAQKHLEQSLDLAKETASRFWLGNATGFLALVYAEQGQTALAETVIDDALGANMLSRAASPRGVQAARGELALGRGEPEQALWIAKELIASDPNHSRRAIPRLERLRGRALLALKRKQEASAALHSGREAAQELGLQWLLWRIDADLAGLPRGHARAEAESYAASARATIEQLAASIPDIPLREHFRTEALARVPGPRPATRKSKKGKTLHKVA